MFVCFTLVKKVRFFKMLFTSVSPAKPALLTENQLDSSCASTKLSAKF